MKRIGPFSQILTMAGLPAAGAISDDQLEVTEQGGVLVDSGKIVSIGPYASLKQDGAEDEKIEGTTVLIPGLVDAHTHICFAGSRAGDYAKRIAGIPYLDILEQGGGIMDTVRKTRAASLDHLMEGLRRRCKRLLSDGITTCEVKSGYGLTRDDEIKMLTAIREVDEMTAVDLIPTCLAAHVCPPEFPSTDAYVDFLTTGLLPEVMQKGLAHRADIFIEQSAFGEAAARKYLDACSNLGFDLTIHADQFTILGSRLAAEYKALSADHLEVSDDAAIRALANAGVIGTVLPGASLGLGLPFAPARKMLDAGMCVAIASDWNPGSAPMGDLLLQAALIGAAEKMTTAETLAGITVRAAAALRLNDRGVIEKGKMADMVAFPCNDYREILYQQGKMKPDKVWKKGKLI